MPRPRLNLTRFHGVFAPNFKHRGQVVPQRASALRVIACIEAPPLIAKILGHVRSHEAVAAIQARAPPAEERTALKLT